MQRKLTPKQEMLLLNKLSKLGPMTAKAAIHKLEIANAFLASRFISEKKTTLIKKDKDIISQISKSKVRGFTCEFKRGLKSLSSREATRIYTNNLANVG